MELSIGKVISSIYRNQSMIINNICKDLGFGSSQYLYLLKISEGPGLTQKDLSELILIDRANTNRALKKLEELGYVTVIPDKDDLRHKRNYLTPEGERVTKQLRTRLLQVTNILKADISESDLEIFLRVINQMEDNIIKSVKEQNGKA